MKMTIHKSEESDPRVIGLDCHPDTFTSALVRGPTPAAAVVENVFNQLPMNSLSKWAAKHTTQFIKKEDLDTVREQIANYRKYRKINQQWLSLALKLAKESLPSSRSLKP